MTCLIALALLVAQARPASEPAVATSRVHGVVVKADTGAPVVRATIELIRMDGRAWEETTDEEGRFDLAPLPAGRYTLTAQKVGYVAARAGQRSPSDQNHGFALADGQSLEFTVRMPRGGAIEGHIVDERGEPVGEVRVRALRSEYVQGGRRLAARKAVQTDDRGHYRLYGLQPGTYYVTAAQGGMDIPTFEPGRSGREVARANGFAPTFLPGTVTAADAQPVSVRAGEDVLGADFVLRSVRLARISGTVVDSRRLPARDCLVMLNPARNHSVGLNDLKLVEVGADGTFVLSSVAPGEYRLDVQPKARFEEVAQTGRAGISPSTADLEYASVPVSVSGEDLDGIRVMTKTGRRLAGRIVVEGTAVTSDVLRQIRISTVDIGARPALSAVIFSAGVTVSPDGTFEVRGVSGTREIRVYGLPPGWALRAVRADGVDVTDSGIEIRDADVAGIEVIVTATPPRISGMAFDATNRPLAEWTVVVFPEDNRRWADPPNRYLATATIADDGSFEISPLPAGDYLVAVVEELIDGEWAESESLERLRSHATKVALGESERKRVTLRSARR
jgi:hypothetical protein